MKRVTIYTTDWCGYCHRAKALLKSEGVPFVEHDVTRDDEKRRWLREVTGRSTVPQIFFDEESIGGCDDLTAIVRAGALASRLKSA